MSLILWSLFKITKVDIRLNEKDNVATKIQENVTNNHLIALKVIQETIQNGLQHSLAILGQKVDKIGCQVEKRLTQGFEKTNSVFTDIVKRLSLIDKAQQKITELSNNVVSLQQILANKGSRGAFGEVQLASLVSNLLPEGSFALQHTLSNGKRADCVLFLPRPTGNIAIDAKFPLENYQKLTEQLPESDLQAAKKLFRSNIRKHLQDIATKYIIPGETADSAVMFIPAEAVFAEIHAHYQDLVELSHKQRVWMVSPTTMMAILTTACAVLKDEATKKQIHIIQNHLGALSKDFARFQNRMEDLARHISQANNDVELVHKTSQKISSRFAKIEKVELEEA